MKSTISFAIFPIILLAILVSNCRSEVEIPSPETVYVFPYASEVDAKNLDCGYHGYESCGDWIKKIVRNKVNYLSAEELIALGDFFHQNHIPYRITEHAKSEWVKDIVAKMRPYLVESEFPYTTYTVASDLFNAFTIPGGNIYVTTGLLEAVQTKDELAYIIGHELGHNENDHTKELARLYQYNKLMEEQGGFFSMSKAILTRITSSICGKSDELECDISAMYLLYQAGYDPEEALGGIDLLRSLSTPKPESKWERMILSFLSTHPWSEDRDRCVREYVREAKVDIQCEQAFYRQKGKVITKQSPLNIRAYPIKIAKKLKQIPRGETVQILCDCIPQSNQRNRDWLYIIYREEGNIFKGWVDKQYIQFL